MCFRWFVWSFSFDTTKEKLLKIFGVRVIHPMDYRSELRTGRKACLFFPLHLTSFNEDD